jgi:hypothetical protein
MGWFVGDSEKAREFLSRHHPRRPGFVAFIGYFCLGLPQVERLELDNVGWEERRSSEACMRVAPLA